MNLKKITQVNIVLLAVCLLTLVIFVVVQKVRKEELHTEEMRHEIDLQNELSDFELGQHYFNVGDKVDGEYDLKKAANYYEKAVSASSTANLLAWYQLGRIEFIQGHFDEAIEKFNAQTTYFGDELPNVYYMLGLTYGYKAQQTNDQSDWQKSEAAFKKFLEYSPDSPWAIVDLSWVYFSQGKITEMKPLLEHGLISHPNHPWLHNMYGLALLNSGEGEQAKVQFQTALTNAESLTEEEWGRAYSGNSPADWGKGLDSFIAAIKKNLALTEVPGNAQP